MNFSSEDYRNILRDHLNKRSQVNPRYSLHAFARDIGISCSRLSLVLNKKRGLSVSAAQDIAQKLGFSKQEISTFCDLVQSQHARSQASRDIAINRLKVKKSYIQGRSLQIDAFKVISDWYHFAILQLMHINGFQSDVNWIAKSLKILPSQAEEALERLFRLELIKKEGNKLVLLQNYLASPDGVSSDAIRKFHKQILEKAIQAIELQPVETRDFTNLMIPIDSAKLPIIKDRIRKFRDEICTEFTHDDEELNSVYSLSIQFFNLGGSP